MKTIAIVQARMGSKRFPGKMLRDLCGRPLVDYCLLRLSKLQKPNGSLDRIVLATSKEKRDDALAHHVATHWPEVLLIRGSEQNVLERFILVIKKYQPDYVVRVTGDCPLINTQAVERMLEEIKSSRASIVNYQPGYEYVDKGVEVMSATALLKAYAATDLSASDQEHVTAYLYRNRDLFNVRFIENHPKLTRADIRITVDTPADLAFLEALSEAMSQPPDQINLMDMVDFLDELPELLQINRQGSKKSTLHERAQVAFRCDGGMQMGLGHIVGSIRLAKLLAKEGYGIEFLTKDNEPSIQLIRKAGFSVDILDSAIRPEEDVKYLKMRAKESNCKALVINFCKSDLLDYQELWPAFKQETSSALVFMDNPIPPSCYLADLSINALPHPHYEGYDPSASDTILDGLEYFILDEIFETYRKQTRTIRDKVERVLIAMGGGDEHNITALILEALRDYNYDGYVDVVLGSANLHEEGIRTLFNRYKLRGEVNKGVSDLPNRIMKADLGFSAIGLTTYEMAALGLPCIIISGNELNTEVAINYVETVESATFIGAHDGTTANAIQYEFNRLAKTNSTRTNLSMKGSAGIGNKVELALEILKRQIDENELAGTRKA